jgi:hypothetical protein
MELVLFVIYLALGYWSTGQTLFYNKIVIHTLGQLFMQRLIFGFILGWILIPVAIILTIVRRKK